MLLCIKLLFWRMLSVWSFVSCLMIALLLKSRKKPMDRYTPRLLYIFFHLCYKITNMLAIIGYVLFMMDFLGIGVFVFGPHPNDEFVHKHSHLKHNVHHEQSQTSDYHRTHWHFSDIGVYIIFYGMYYGVLTRDTAQLCCAGIAKSLGFFNPSGFPRRRVPKNICAVCNQALTTHSIFAGLKNTANDEFKEEKMNSMAKRAQFLLQRRKDEEYEQNAKLQKQKKNGLFSSFCSIFNPFSDINEQDSEICLDCGHRFHGFCIRGWVMIGKRDICPVCKEKVNTKGIFASPWQKSDRMWSQLLDGVRYLIVWNPIIVFCVYLVFTLSGIPFQDISTDE